MNGNKIQQVLLVAGLMLGAFSLVPGETGCVRVGFDEDAGNVDANNADLGNTDMGTADLGTADEISADLDNADVANVDEGNAEFGGDDAGTLQDDSAWPEEAAAIPPLITTVDLPLALVGQSYQATLAATAGTPPYTWAVLSGDKPAWLTLDSQTGVLSGTPDEAVDHNLVFQVIDSREQTNDKSLTLHCDRVEQRSIFLWAWTVGTKEAADVVFDEIEGMHANMVDLLALWDIAYYRTANPELIQSSLVTQDFDPLGYAVESLHARGIAVHVTLALGQLSSSLPVFANHPDWRAPGPAGQMYSAQKGYGVEWIDLGNPATHSFLSSIIQETAQNFDVDGILLTYVGYPSEVIWGFSSYNRNEFFQRTGLDSNRLTAASLPAVMNCFGNQLKTPTTAQVLTTFSTGTPAVLLNSPDGGVTKGESVLLNWDAIHSQMPAVDFILKNSVVYLNRTNLLVLQTPDDYWDTASIWLKRQGFSPTNVTLVDLPTSCQSGDNLIVIPLVYVWTETDAAALEQCFNNGNSIIYIGGPTPSIENGTIGTHLQNILGLSQRGSYLGENVYTMQAAQVHPIIPPVDGSTPESELVNMWNAWIDYLIDAVNGFVTQISLDVKPALPDRPFGIIVAPLFYYIREYFGDWPTWYNSGLFDYYLNFMNWEVSLASYQQGIAEQKTIDPDLVRVFPGITPWQDSMTIDEFNAQVDAGRQAGSRVIFFYRYEDMSLEKKNLISTTIWPHKVPAYNPPLIRP